MWCRASKWPSSCGGSTAKRYAPLLPCYSMAVQGYRTLHVHSTVVTLGCLVEYLAVKLRGKYCMEVRDAASWLCPRGKAFLLPPPL